jgi:hypothetical protein
MRKLAASIFIFMFVILCPPGFAKSEEQLLCSGGSTGYTIILPNDATDGERFVANDLAAHLERISGATFQVIEEQDAGQGPFIFAGPSKLMEKRTEATREFILGLGQEELVIQTCGEDLVLAGGRPRGTVYAVYTFLEDVLGCHWLTPEVTHYPNKPVIRLPELNKQEKPVFEFRNPGYQGYTKDALFCARNLVNGIQEGESSRQYWPGGRFRFVTPRGWHTFASLVPAKTLMDEHPEWFSQGTSKDDFQRTGQLCLTNPELENYLVERLRKMFNANPDAYMASITHNDNGNYCKCESCRKETKAKGPSGVMIEFVNRIARRLKDEFPEAVFVTFAYQYTQKPPLDPTIRADHNVAVWLTTEGPSRNAHLEETMVGERLKKWAEIAPKVFVWNYEGNYSYPMAPMANLHVQDDNYEFFAGNNVCGVLSQGSLWSWGEFEKLRGWLVGKLMWNPYADGDAIIDQFLKLYYGPEAAPLLREFIDWYQEATREDVFNLYEDVHKSPAFDWRKMLQGQRIFEQAEAAAAGHPEYHTRVKQARLQVDYMVVLRGQEYIAEARRNGVEWPRKYDSRVRGQAFLETAESTGLAEEWEATDRWLTEVLKRSGNGALGVHGGTWNKFRYGNPALIPAILRRRLSILNNAVAYAARSFEVVLAQRYLEVVKKAIEEQQLPLRDAPEELEAVYLKKHEVGRFRDWENVEQQGRLTADDYNYGLVENDEDCSGVFNLGWNEKYLFVFCEVTDDVYMPVNKESHMASGFEDDHVQVCFNMMNDKGLPRDDGTFSSHYGPDDFNIGASAEGVLYHHSSNPLFNDVPEGTVVETKRTHAGYLWEIAVPWESLFLEQPVEDYSFGYTMMIGDCDRPVPSLDGMLLWRGKMAYANTKGWSSVRLVK